jgi:hypothetical protein
MHVDVVDVVSDAGCVRAGRDDLVDGIEGVVVEADVGGAEQVLELRDRPRPMALKHFVASTTSSRRPFKAGGAQGVGRKSA